MATLKQLLDRLASPVEVAQSIHTTPETAQQAGKVVAQILAQMPAEEADPVRAWLTQACAKATSLALAVHESKCGMVPTPRSIHGFKLLKATAKAQYPLIVAKTIEDVLVYARACGVNVPEELCKAECQTNKAGTNYVAKAQGKVSSVPHAVRALVTAAAALGIEISPALMTESWEDACAKSDGIVKARLREREARAAKRAEAAAAKAKEAQQKAA